MKIVDLRSFFISESNEMKKYINEGLKDAKQLFVLIDISSQKRPK